MILISSCDYGKFIKMISFQGDVQQNPSMLSCSTGNRLALVLDSCVHIFPQDFGSSLEDTEVISIDVGINIDAINLSECGNFVLLALSNGSCQLVNIPTKTPLPPLRISKPKDIPELDGDTKTNVRKYYSTCWIEYDTELCSLFLLSVQGEVSNDQIIWNIRSQIHRFK